MRVLQLVSLYVAMNLGSSGCLNQVFIEIWPLINKEGNASEGGDRMAWENHMTPASPRTPAASVSLLPGRCGCGWG